KLAALKEKSAEEYDLFRQAVAHILMGLGGEDEKDTKARIKGHGPISDSDIIGALTVVMRQEAFNHKNLQAIDGRLPNGMSVMAMAAHTGCNTVYGLKPANQPPLPGRDPRRLAPRRELHRRPRAPVGRARTAGGRAAAPDRAGDHAARV